MTATAMTVTEKRAAFSLSAIFAVRMLGLFLILPVFSLYALTLKSSSPTLIGIALGIYGLTQALCQIPLGTWSDKVGRKPIIIAGFVLFIVGSLIAGLSHSIYGVIIGRALQGAGAVGSTISAMLADLTRSEHRTKAMAVIGTSIGVTFSLSMVLGPVLNSFIGVSGIFLLTAFLGLIAILILLFLVPKVTQPVFHPDAEPILKLFKFLLRDKELLRLDFGILISHALLTASFVVIPIALKNSANLAVNKQWLVYLPALFFAFVAMVPMIIVAEKKQKLKNFFLISVLLLSLSELILWFNSHSVVVMGIALFLFFTAFSFLEAALPSLISKRAPAAMKGTAMGIYSSAQFLGIFLGGYFGGLLYEHRELSSVFLICAILALFWFVFSVGMQKTYAPLKTSEI